MFAGFSASFGSICRYWYASASVVGLDSFTAPNTSSIALACALCTVTSACASPSARRIADCFCPSLCRMSAFLLPSARRIADCASPSAVRMAARFCRSACICFSMAIWMSLGGAMSLSSSRLTRTPHFSVTSSSTIRSWLLTWSRLVSEMSRLRPPITLRSVVCVSCSMAASRLATW